ncbi:MAG TPA: DUF899 family protein [Rhizomicrobium sp.]|jgi:predicted dithiol-disulfide oxidoreductase (DUF899 family)
MGGLSSQETTNRPVTFPGESAQYRAARDKLLQSEIALRRQIEAVAAERRALPPGGPITQDYVFERTGTDGAPQAVRMSELFGDSPTLVLYSFMYGPDRKTPCPGCTHFLDGMDGASLHIVQRVPFYVVARSPLSRLEALARDRGWQHLNFLADSEGAYTHDYLARNENGDQPMLNTFQRANHEEGGVIRHFWGSEMMYAPTEPGQHIRHNDLMDPVWNLFDVTPEGRGDFFPKLSYP